MQDAEMLPDTEHRALECVSMSELESMVPELESLSSIDAMLQRSAGENAWVCFEADVRSAAATALDRLRGQGSERCAELLRLCEFEEQTRCQAFQVTMMGEVGPAVYQATVNSIIEKLLGKLETWEPIHYQATTQCLSDYMSALNHHCNICAVPHATTQLPAIAEGRETGMGSDVLDSSDYPSGSEENETLSVHSEGGSAYVRRVSTGDLPSTGFAQGFSQGALSVLGGSCGRPPVAVGAGTIAGLAAGGMTVSGGTAVSGAAGGSGTAPMGTDVEEARKERRRESNKKASVKYRSKKAGSVHQIVTELATARQQVGTLTSQVAVLSAENQLLKQQVAFLQGVMQQQPPHGHASAPSTTPPSDAPSSAATTTAPPLPAPPLPLQAPPLPAQTNATAFPRHYLSAMPSGPASSTKVETPFTPAMPNPFSMCPFSAAPTSAPAGPPAVPAPAAAPAVGHASVACASAAAAASGCAVTSGAATSAQQFSTTDCGTGCGVSEWLTADANLRL